LVLYKFTPFWLIFQINLQPEQAVCCQIACSSRSYLHTCGKAYNSRGKYCYCKHSTLPTKKRLQNRRQGQIK